MRVIILVKCLCVRLKVCVASARVYVCERAPVFPVVCGVPMRASEPLVARLRVRRGSFGILVG